MSLRCMCVSHVRILPLKHSGKRLTKVSIICHSCIFWTGQIDLQKVPKNMAWKKIDLQIWKATMFFRFYCYKSQVSFHFTEFIFFMLFWSQFHTVIGYIYKNVVVPKIYWNGILKKFIVSLTFLFLVAICLSWQQPSSCNNLFVRNAINVRRYLFFNAGKI